MCPPPRDPPRVPGGEMEKKDGGREKESFFPSSVDASLDARADRAQRGVRRL